MKRESFVIRRSFYEPLKDLALEEKGVLFDAICNYALDETAPEGLSPSLRIAFSFISSNIDRDAEKYQSVIDRNRLNGSKGGRPPKNPEEPKQPSGFFGNPEEPKKPDSVSDSVSVSVSEKKKKTKVFIPPSLKEVIEFFLLKGSDENTAKKAFDHYDIADWKNTNGKPVGSWKQTMLTNWINSSHSYMPNGVKPTARGRPGQILQPDEARAAELLVKFNQKTATI